MHGKQILEKYQDLTQNYFELVRKIEKTNEKLELKQLLLKLDSTFLELLCYYLFFVYAGYGGDKPAIAKFLRENKSEFEKARNSTIDTHMVKNFPVLFGKFKPELQKFVPYLSRKELLSTLDNNELNMQVVEQRQIEYLLITKEGKITEIQFNEIKTSLQKELPAANVQVSEIQGQTANPGIAKGAVVIVLTSKDYGKIKQGDILVTTMTKPDIVPYLSVVS